MTSRQTSPDKSQDKKGHKTSEQERDPRDRLPASRANTQHTAEFPPLAKSLPAAALPQAPPCDKQKEQKQEEHTQSMTYARGKGGAQKKVCNMLSQKLSYCLV